MQFIFQKGFLIKWQIDKMDKIAKYNYRGEINFTFSSRYAVLIRYTDFPTEKIRCIYQNVVIIHYGSYNIIYFLISDHSQRQIVKCARSKIAAETFIDGTESLAPPRRFYCSRIMTNLGNTETKHD